MARLLWRESLEGDVTASSLDIEPGAFYMGHIATQESNAPSTLPVTDPYPELMSTKDAKY